MIEDISSQDSSLVSEERSLVLHLILTNFGGEEIQLSTELQEFDRLNEFENAVLENLPYIEECSTFGCELDYTRKILADPIWDTLQDNNCFNLIVRQCIAQAGHKGQLKSRVKAIRVPSNGIDRVLPHAFSHISEVRHVQVEAGIHTIGEGAWQSCLRLQVVQLPSTVVCLQDGVFRRSYALRTVLAPGCKYFGICVFEECCSLVQIGAQGAAANQLASQVQVRWRAFEKCSALRISFEKTEYDPAT